MANALYNKFKQSLVRAEIDWVDHDIKALLIDTSLYTFDQSDVFLDDIPSGAIIATSTALGTKTDSNGVLGSATITFTSVGSSRTANAIIVYKDSGVAGTSSLIGYLDTNISNFPLETNGSNVTFTLNSGNLFSI